MSFATINRSSRLLAAALAMVAAVWSATSYAASGNAFVLPLGPKHPSGLTLHVDGHGIDANGYRPVRVTVTTWPPNKPLTADRQVRVVLSFYGYGGRKSRISQVVELPEGSASVTGTVLVPQMGPFSHLSIETFEGGEKLKELSTDPMSPMGWLNPNGGNWTEARPALLFIDSHAPSRGERLDLVKAFETTATDSSPTLTMPDVRPLLSLIPDLGNPRIPRGSPTSNAMNPAVTSSITDTGLLTVLAARTRAEIMPPSELPDRWIELSQFDVATISLTDLRSMAGTQPKQMVALRDWLSTGPLMIVYGAGKEFGNLPEIEKLLAIPAIAPDPSLSSLRGWTPPSPNSRTGSLTATFADTAEASPYPIQRKPALAAAPSAASDATPELPPNTWSLSALPPFISRPSATGRVVAIASDNPFPGRRSDWDWVFTDINESHWQSFKRNGVSQQRTNRDYWKLLIPGVGEAPVISYLLLVSLFAIVIGPINYLLLDRSRRLYLLLVTVPAGAVLVTASLFAFAVVSDGLTMRLRIRSFAELDQQTGRAAVWSRQSYYAALAPSRGLHFPDDTTVFPLVYEPSDSGHDKTTLLVWDGEQQLRGGYLASRTASQFIVSRATRSKEKLVVREGADSSQPPGVENQLAANIKYLLLRDSRGDYFAAKSIRDKSAADLTPIDPAEAQDELLAIAKPVQPDVPRDDFDPDKQDDNIFSLLGVRRHRYGNSDGSAGDPLMDLGLLETNLKQALNPKLHPLASGSYIAILDRSPLVVTGVGLVREEASFHVIRGRY